MSRRLAAPILVSVAVALIAASPATAEFGPIRLLSKRAAEQADRAVAPALSADGNFLAFQGSIGGESGVFREDLESGAVVPVAAGAPEDATASTDAAAPSISADGRYVSFTTSRPLDPDDDTQPESRDVYVADMSSSPPSYELASALDGCDPGEATVHAACGLTYTGGGGSEASGRVALSADGREVVFFTTAASDLTSGAGGSTPGTPTPPFQVVLRDLADHSTTLVSAERDPETGAMTSRPVAGGTLVTKPQLPLLRGAALSADGTTVAWLGTHLPAQVALLAGEAPKIAELDANGSFPYDEPLWRRVADGPAAPIRRIVAGDGPADPFPDLTHKSDINGAEGWLGVNVDGVPQLSADGRTVALTGNPTEATNVFVADMGEGLSRQQALRQLTREVPISESEGPTGINSTRNVPLDGHVYDIGVSGDGRRIAFATARQRFPLSPPNLIGSPPSGIGLVELYELDLESEALVRVTHGIGGVGEPSLAPGQVATEGAGAKAPSFGAGGRLLAFASTAANLTEGDGNEASDAFLVEDVEGSRAPPETSVAGGPVPLRLRPRWRLTLSASSLPDGGVRLVVVVPAAGALRAGVGAELGPGARSRRLTRAATRAPGQGPVKMKLRLPHRLRGLARGREGLYATVSVSFRGESGRILHGRLPVRFHVHGSAKGARR